MILGRALPVWIGGQKSSPSPHLPLPQQDLILSLHTTPSVEASCSRPFPCQTFHHSLLDLGQRLKPLCHHWEDENPCCHAQQNE